ncbi:hypothetical protein [Paenibacillus sp. 23TSA30-6]|uniref:hypothetical protein n=1 Tax=Paenibacillus sp. 23TSA30-6 TaxID=2546104 RepID=UPI00178807C3|nr:hypothetical protein [Paenibacillus sp. 23TSA30-6]
MQWLVWFRYGVILAARHPSLLLLDRARPADLEEEADPVEAWERRGNAPRTDRALEIVEQEM